MKLILAILAADAVEPVSRALVDAHISVTQISSVGGFLRRGNSTLMIGVEDDQLQHALGIVREACRPLRKPEGHTSTVTIFVVNAGQFVQI
jgi:uncharacterized protein YaaQ